MLYVWFLIVTISGPGSDGTLVYDAQPVAVFDSLSKCETAAYAEQDKAIMYEKRNSAEVELKCIKHTTKTTV